jgi:hypothetical protein
MAKTYQPIATYTASSNQTSIAFSSLGSYSDIVVIFDGLSSSGAGNTLSMVFNSDANSAYSATRIQGNGTTASSTRFTSDPTIAVVGSSNRSNALISIMDYRNTTTNKTSLSRFNNMDSSDDRTGSYVQLRSSTTAITTITFSIPSAQIATTSTITLYGIKAA